MGQCLLFWFWSKIKDMDMDKQSLSAIVFNICYYKVIASPLIYTWQ